MKTLLIEQYSGGHYDNYLATLLPPLLAISDEVVVATTPGVAAKSRILREQRSSHTPSLTVWPGLPEISPSFSLKDRWTAAQGLTDCLTHHRPDQTLITSADPHAMGLALGALAGRQPLKTEYSIDATFHCGYTSASSGSKSWIKRIVYEMSQRHCGLETLGFVNFEVYEDLVARRVFDPRRIRLVGDPVPQPAPLGRDAVRRMLGFNADDFYLGVLGSIDRRRAVPELLRMFRKADLGPKTHLVLGGRIAAAYRVLIETGYADLLKDGRLVVIDRHLTETEMTHGYEALDLCTPLYYAFPGLASLALKALACRCPLFVADFGWMGALVRQFGVGTAAPLAEVDDCARALRAAVDSAHEPLPAEPLRRLMAFHTPENFTAHMLRSTRERLGVLPAPQLIEWSWVREALA